MHLADACRLWQSGDKDHTGPIRGGARLLTGIPHYYAAAFISDFEEQAKRTPKFTQAARTLLKAVAASEWLTSEEWGSKLGLADVDAAARGIKAKEGIDRQIESALRTGSIDMPLWGASLNRTVAERFGKRFIFELDGPFQAVPAWVQSGEKAGERELIMSGRYTVTDYLPTTEDGETKGLVKVRQLERVELLRS